ncbi:uncharacterized protein LOC135683933 [Rhopilema esculentum]|uniref:uncharacterized protein LOC135683933 n=1 Tax=Rhopilema esculentum TaxID=499914 RepID=UPI0031D29980
MQGTEMKGANIRRGKDMAEHSLRKRPKILLSNFSAEERKVLSDKIRSLGGIIYESSNYTPLATHIICKTPSRGEKFICGCVSGKWILPQSYIIESTNKRKWLDEESFEWTIEHCETDSPLRDLFSLPKKCKRFLKHQKLVFQNWIVLLIFTSPKKKESYKRLIEAGGGRVVNWKPPYRGSDLKVIKFVIYDDMKKRELFTLKRAKVPMISCEDMIEYVIKGTNPRLSNNADKTSPKQEMKTPPSANNNNCFQLSSGLGYKNIIKSSERDNLTLREKHAKKQTVLKDFFIKIDKIHGQNKTSSSVDKKVDDLSSSNSDVKTPCSPYSRKTTCLNNFHVRKDIFGSKALSSYQRDSQRAKDSSARGFSEAELKQNGSIPIQQMKASDKSGVLSAKSQGSSGIDCSSLLVKSKAHCDVIEIVDTEDSQNCLKAGKDHCNTAKFEAARVKDKAFSSSVSPKVGPVIQHDAKPVLSVACEPTAVCDKVQICEVPAPCSKSLEVKPIKETTSTMKVMPSQEKQVEKRKQDLLQCQEKVETKNTVKTRKRKAMEIDISFLLDNSGPKTRSSGNNKAAKDVKVTESPPKKTKLIEELHITSEPVSHYAPSLQPSHDITGTRRRFPLHRNGTDLIEGCLEEEHYQTAVRMMLNYLTPTFYLPSRMIHTLMELQRKPVDTLDRSLASCIRSILNRCVLLHPPQFLQRVYLAAFAPPLDSDDQVKEPGLAFEYIMSTFRDFKAIFSEGRVENSIRKQTLMDLIKFIVTVLETDFMFHAKGLESCKIMSGKGTSRKRPVLAQMLWVNESATGSGAMTNELIMFALELTRVSQDIPELVALRGLVFRLIRIAADCCQLCDVRTVSIAYGPASRLFTLTFCELVSNYLAKSGTRRKDSTSIFAFLKPKWLLTRLADFMIGSYDATRVKDASRKLLSKPLSLEKIVSCYFHLIPTHGNDTMVTDVSKRKKKNSSKPLSVIGNTETSRINASRGQNEKRIAVKRNVKGETQLHVACIKDRPTDVKLLLLNGLDPNLKDNAGWTALHEASNHGHTTCVAELLKCKDLDVFATGLGGFSALHDAVANNQLAVAKLLIEAGGITLLEMKTDSGQTAYDLANTNTLKDLIMKGRKAQSSNAKSGLTISQKVSQKDLEEYLLLLTVLLRNVTGRLDETELDFEEMVLNLTNHAKNVCRKQTTVSRMLLCVIKGLVC